LARTYLEVGRYLVNHETGVTMLDGLAAQAYLEKAAGLFSALNLEWDLERLRAVTEPTSAKTFSGIGQQPDR
jgi:hypothetical protein